MSEFLSLNRSSLSLADYATLKEINEDYEKNKAEIENYLKNKNPESHVTQNPVVVYLTETDILGILKEGLHKVLVEIEKTGSFYKQRTTFNGLDYLAEYLYNMNPRYPERRELMTNIFDIEWVKQLLKERPRPLYKYSIIWNEDTAATKIQAFFRGYLLRKQLEVQEVRGFWKTLKKK